MESDVVPEKKAIVNTAPICRDRCPQRINGRAKTANLSVHPIPSMIWPAKRPMDINPVSRIRGHITLFQRLEGSLKAPAVLSVPLTKAIIAHAISSDRNM